VRKRSLMPYTDNLLTHYLNPRCEGSRFIVCYCGGDLCVCGLDGEDCLGCDDCVDTGGEEQDQEWEELRRGDR
jgi:hypothetical protein